MQGGGCAFKSRRLHLSVLTAEWRAAFASEEVAALHADAFGGGRDGACEDVCAGACDWLGLAERHSLGWAVVRDGGVLVGWANVAWDGRAHAWLQDVMVATSHRRRGIGTALVAAAREGAREAGCERLHVDFEERLAGFYLGACGFAPTAAGLLRLR